MRRHRLSTLLSAIISISMAVNANAKPDGPEAGRTGAPGEQTCADGRCHTTFELNSGNGSLSLLDPPESYSPGQTYQLFVQLEDVDQSRWGFQLTTLDDSGAAAGILRAGSPDSTQSQVEDGRIYINHTETGTWQGTPDGPVTWRVTWTTPAVGTGPVTVYFAGNAANNNDRRTNDYIYTSTHTMTEDAVTEGLDLALGNIPASVARGSNLVFTAQVTNAGSDVAFFDEADLTAAGPIPPKVLPLYAGPAIPVNPGSPLTAPVIVPVPGIAPTGTYQIDVSIYEGGVVLDTESFDLDITN